MRFIRPLGAVKVASVTALAGAACAMGVLPAGAATASVTRYATTTVVSIPKTGYTLTNITLSVTEKGKGGNPTGTVTFWIGGRRLCHGSLYRRKTSCTAQILTAGTKTVTARYSGNAMHKPSSGTATIKVTKKPSGGGGGSVGTTTTVTNPSADVYAYVHAGDSTNVTATVAPTSGSSVPTGTVAFTLVDYPGPGTPPASLECKATLAAGKASCQVTAPVNSYGFVLYEATYTPTADSEWTGSNSLQAGVDHKLVTWDVTKTAVTSPAATENDAVTLTADVTDQGNDSLASAFSEKPDLVTFSIGGVAIPGCSNVAVTDVETPPIDPDNIATCSYTPTATGTVTITATYSGDDYALPSTGTENLTVNP
jgi:Bacterial Ig-like domain (group 3)